MSGAHPSVMSLAGLSVYVLVLAACIAASVAAVRHRQQDWHGRGWAVLALVFAGLAMMRWFAIEEVVREALRGFLRSEAAYSERREFQRLMAAAVIGLSLACGGVWFFRAGRAVRGRRNVAVLVAVGSAAVLLGLVALRLISLHQIDAILYAGPLRLNWLVDLGASLTVLASAVFYMRTVGRHPGQPRRRA